MLLLARHPEPRRHLPIVQGNVSAMNKNVCWSCRLPVPRLPNGKREGPWELRDGSRKWLCRPCILIRIYDSEVAEANRHLDEVMSEHLRHQRSGRFAGCPICAVEV